MTARFLLDTNVLAYPYDRSELVKARRAIEVLEEVAIAEAGIVSTQVLGELFVTLTGKLRGHLSESEAYQAVAHYYVNWQILDVTRLVVMEALHGVRDHHLHYFDAQIWAVARLNRIELVLSEDFNDGAVVEGVRFLNPFAAHFRISDWI